MTRSDTQKTYVILGATSAIAVATARRLAARAHALVLVGRRGEALETIAADLRVRGASQVTSLTADLASHDDPDGLLGEAANGHTGLDGILIFYGVLGDQARAEREPEHASTIIDVNFTSAAAWAMAGARALEAHGSGVLLAVSSVAGDRGRRSNYIYGAAKAGLSVLMQGLAHKWAGGDKPLRAVTMKLGFVDTPMTDGLEKSGPLWAKPDDIAATIEKALAKGGPNVYGPWFWRWIMLAIRTTPAFVFNKVNL